MIYTGCDLGSTTGKVVLIDENSRILGSSIIKSAHGPQKTFEASLSLAIKDAGLEGQISGDQLVAYGNIVTTGYGRTGVAGLSNDISEISCHAKGASFDLPSTRTIVDIGGQDCKVISVTKTGRVADFAMNDKCSAGTGRFFEVMSRVLDTDLENLSDLALQSDNPRQISKQCSVFAESEVISFVNANVPLTDIAAGIHDSIARRITGMVYKAGVEEDVVLTGGCAQNKALRKYLEKRLGVRLAPLNRNPQLMGALGAALFAREEAGKRA